MAKFSPFGRKALGIALNLYMLKKTVILIPVLLLLWMAGCRQRPDFFVEKGALDFSTDTIFFDSIFTNLPSPTERVTVVNNTKDNIDISQIRLEDGTEFTLAVDGVFGDTIAHYQLPQGDSLVAFVSFTSQQRDVFVRDRLLFTIGDQVQHVDIEAFVFDAIVYRDSLLGQDGSTSTYLDPTKRHLIDGYLYVPDGHALYIPAGTQLYFTPRQDEFYNLVSGLYVFGRLFVQGVQGNEVVFQGSRFGRRYEETPAQWRGISFGNLARASTIEHAIIKNGLIGVYQEYGNPGFGPKVLVERSEIRNMGAYGVVSNGYTQDNSAYPLIRMQNSLVHNCKEGNVALLGGGRYDFIHCTFANYTIDFIRNSPQILINNYDEDQNLTFYCKASFTNCIIWGSEEDEVVMDSFPIPNQWDVFFNNSLVRTTLQLKGENIVASQNLDFPKFKDPNSGRPNERDYHLEINSPAVNIGRAIPGYIRDKDEVLRSQQPDAGCYEQHD